EIRAELLDLGERLAAVGRRGDAVSAGFEEGPDDLERVGIVVDHQDWLLLHTAPAVKEVRDRGAAGARTRPLGGRFVARGDGFGELELVELGVEAASPE